MEMNVFFSIFLTMFNISKWKLIFDSLESCCFPTARCTASKSCLPRIDTTSVANCSKFLLRLEAGVMEEGRAVVQGFSLRTCLGNRTSTVLFLVNYNNTQRSLFLFYLF